MSTKLIPILFSTPMVQAILEGRKTMTRRTNKLKNISVAASEIIPCDAWPKQGDWAARFKIGSDPDKFEVTDVIKCPYGKVGDVLWVREKFHFDEVDGYNFYADNYEDKNSPDIKWKPSIHMPFAACRIFLRINNIRVERLNDISEQDAIAEGVDNWTWKDMATPQNWMDYNDKYAPPLFCAEHSFETLWASINGEDSWNANPWVWVVSFERCEKPTV